MKRRKRFSNLSIAQYFVLFIAVLMFVVVFSLLLFYFFNRKTLTYYSQNQLTYAADVYQGRARDMASSYLDVFRNVQTEDLAYALVAFANTPNTDTLDRVDVALLDAINRQAGDVMSIVILNPLYEEIFSTNHTEFNLDLPKSTFKIGMQTPQYYVLVDGENRHLFLIGSYQPLPRAPTYLLAVEIAPEKIISLQDEFASLSRTGELFFVTDSTSELVATIVPVRFEESFDYTTEPARLSPSLYAVSRLEGIYTSLIDYRGEWVTAATRYIPGANWGLVVKMDEDEIYAPLGILRSLIIMSLALLAFLAFVFLFFMHEFVFEPIQRLAKVAKGIQKGEYHHTFPKTTKNEIGVLSRTLRRMTSNLIDLNTSLASQVQKKTATLQKMVSTLEHERARDEALLMSIGDGIVAADKNGKIILMNSVAEDLFDVSFIKARKSPIIDWFVLKDHAGKKSKELPKAKNPIIRVLQKNEPLNSITCYLCVKGKDDIPVRITASAVVDGKINDGVIVIVHDLTKEREVERLKSDFISIASHQLRGPLASLKWYGSVLADSGEKRFSDEQKQAIERMNWSTQQMIYLVDDFLDVSRIESGKVEIKRRRCDPEKLMKKIVQTLELQIKEKHHKVKIVNRMKTKTVITDVDMLREIYTNLMTNAIKYTKNQGKITITLSKKGSHFITAVKDTGVGIPEKDKKQVFAKFFRSDIIVEQGYQGTGLGLYTAQELAKRLGGKITFESKQNIGSTFRVSLPLTLKSK